MVLKSIMPRGVVMPKTEPIALTMVGERAQPTLTKTKTIVVAKLTEPSGQAQSSQLYMYGTPRPKPNPKTMTPINKTTMFGAKATMSKPKATRQKPAGKIKSCRRLKKKPNEAPIGIPNKVETPAIKAEVLAVPIFSATIKEGNS